MIWYYAGAKLTPTNIGKNWLWVFLGRNIEYICRVIMENCFMKKVFYLAFVAVVCSLLSCEKGFESKKESDDVVKINLPPANEVWYTSTTGDVIELSQYPYKLVSNTYRNGIGKYKFEQDVVNIGDYFGSKKNTDEILSQFKSLTLPSGITDINAYYAIGNLYNASSLILPENLKSIGCDFIGNFGKNLPEKHIYFFICRKLFAVLYLIWYNISVFCLIPNEYFIK